MKIGVNQLPIEKRRLILNMLVEGSSMRSISRITDVSINTVSKLLADAGDAALVMHTRTCRTSKPRASSVMRFGRSAMPSRRT